MPKSKNKPALSLELLRARYEALGPEEMPGGESYFGHCSTWSGFLAHGCAAAGFWAQRIRAEGEDAFFGTAEGRWNPGFVRLVLSAWPGCAEAGVSGD